MAVPDATAFIGLMQSLKAAQDIISSLVGLRVSGKIAEASKQLLDMTERAMAAQRENAALVARVGELEKELIAAKRQHSDLEQYELVEISAGAFAYVCKPNSDIAGPPHWLCPNCFSNGHKSILVKDFIHTNTEDIYGCPRCKTDLWPGCDDHLEMRSVAY